MAGERVKSVRGAGSVLGLLAVLAVGATVTTAAAAAPADPRCLSLVAGNTGLITVGGLIPTPDQLAGRVGGFGPAATPEVAAELPRDVVFRTPTATFGREYAFALRAGRVYVKRAAIGRGLPGEQWHLLEVPACLAGRITEISADHRLLIALDAERQIYAHDMSGGDLSPQRWTWRWGPALWLGGGMRMPADVAEWSTSEFTGAETFRDTSGRRQTPIGVATVYLLRSGGRRITYIDPWLPADDSREVCTPRRGATTLASLSASGSTVLAISRRGEIYTRLYDFDTSGANTVFGSFSWQQDRPAGDTRWQLPGPAWVRHQNPPGTVTDRVSIAKTGTDAADRLLRIEGSTRAGRVGYWEKPIGRSTGSPWRFVATGGRLQGRRLRFRAKDGRGPVERRHYAGRIAGAPAEVVDFNAECSPAKLEVQVVPGLRLDLLLHSSDGLRQDTRARGLDDIPREYNGAIEVPRALFNSLSRRDPRLRAWIDEHLGGRRIATAPIAVTRTRMRFLAQCWVLALDGQPARPDRLRIPPDPGILLGRLTEQLQDGRGAPAC